MIKFNIKSFDEMNKYILGLSVILIGGFIAYFYLVTQSWTELPFSTCTPFESPYDDVLVPLERNGLTLIYSPDEGFNTCRTNIMYHIAPVISLISGVIVFSSELFGLRDYYELDYQDSK